MIKNLSTNPFNNTIQKRIYSFDLTDRFTISSDKERCDFMVVNDLISKHIKSLFEWICCSIR